MLATPHATILIEDIPLPMLDSFEDEVEELDTTTGIPFIKVQEMADLMKNGKELKIFDCRFPYEYKAGHIVGASNLGSIKEMEKFFNSYEKVVKSLEVKGKSINDLYILFHCEFSSVRGPSFAKIFREMDRMRNSLNYPALSFPNVFIIHGGFKEIYSERPDLCTGIYLTMHDDTYVQNGELSRMNRRYKEEISNFNRSKGGKRVRRLTSSQPIFHPFVAFCF